MTLIPSSAQGALDDNGFASLNEALALLDRSWDQQAEGRVLSLAEAHKTTPLEEPFLERLLIAFGQPLESTSLYDLHPRPAGTLLENLALRTLQRLAKDLAEEGALAEYRELSGFRVIGGWEQKKGGDGEDKNEQRFHLMCRFRGTDVGALRSEPLVRLTDRTQHVESLGPYLLPFESGRVDESISFQGIEIVLDPLRPEDGILQAYYRLSRPAFEDQLEKVMRGQGFLCKIMWDGFRSWLGEQTGEEDPFIEHAELRIHKKTLEDDDKRSVVEFRITLGDKTYGLRWTHNDTFWGSARDYFRLDQSGTDATDSSTRSHMSD